MDCYTSSSDIEFLDKLSSDVFLCQPDNNESSHTAKSDSNESSQTIKSENSQPRDELNKQLQWETASYNTAEDYYHCTFDDSNELNLTSDANLGDAFINLKSQFVEEYESLPELTHFTSLKEIKRMKTKEAEELLSLLRNNFVLEE